MKKVVSLCLVAFLVCSLFLCAVSCKNTKQKSSDAANAGAEKIPGGVADVSPEVLEALSNSGEVQVYNFDGDEVSKQSKDFADYFAEVYGGNVVYRQIVWGGWQDTFITDFAADTAPDVIGLWYLLWPKAATRGMVYSVKELEEKGVIAIDHPLFDNEKELLANNFSFNKNVYSLGVEFVSGVYCCVNTDLFKQYSVKSPVEYYKEGTWNFDSFEKCCTELTRDVDGDDIVDSIGYNGWDYNWFVVANGGQLVEADKDGKLYDNLDSVNVNNGLNWLHRVFGIKKLGSSTNEFDSFAGGKVGILGALKSNIAKAIVDNDITFNWDVVPFPLGPDNPGGIMPGDLNGYAITSSTENPQGAMNYIIALKTFGTLFGKNYESNMDCFSEDQLNLFDDYDLQAKNAFFMGVGTLWDNQWGFWMDIGNAGADVTEVLEKYRPQFEAQCEFEMENAVA